MRRALTLAIAALTLVGHVRPGLAAPTASTNATTELQRLQALCKELIVDKSNLLEAKPVVEDLLARTVRLRGEEHFDMVVALHWVGYLAQQAGDQAGAEKAWQRSLSLQERLPVRDPVWQTRALHMLAGLYRKQSDFGRAEKMLRLALEVRTETLGSEHPETAMVLRTLGQLYKDKGDFAAAESHLLRALGIFETPARQDSTAAAETLMMLGAFYFDLGDLEKAESLVARGLAMQERLLGPDHVHTLNSILLLAEVQRDRGRLRDSESLFLRNVHGREQLNGPDDLSLLWPLQQLADLCINEKRFAEAERWLERLQTVYGKRFPLDHSGLAGFFDAKGRLEFKRRNFVEAQRQYRQAFLVAEKHLGADHFSTMVYRREGAELNYLLGHQDLALAEADAIQRSEEKRLSEVLSFTSERQRLLFHQRFLGGHSLHLWASMGAARPLARAVLRTKGIVLHSLLEDRVLARASTDPEIRDQIHELNRLRLRLTQTYFDERVQPADSAKRDSHASTAPSPAHRFEAVQASLSRKVTAVGGTRRALQTRLEDVQHALPAGSVLIEFLYYKQCGAAQKSYGALIIAREHEPRWIQLGEAPVLEKNIRLYQHLVRSEDSSASLEATLRDLGRQLWTPLAAALPAGTKRLFICPDAKLNFVSFATLLTSSNRFLAEDYSISYVSTGRDLMHKNPPRTSTRQLVILANPYFGGSPDHRVAMGTRQETPWFSSKTFRSLELRSLPGSERESRQLHERADKLGFAKAVLCLGKEASEQQLDRVQSPEILHLATHGFVLAEPPDEADGNPMLRSGLALAGARNTLRAWANGSSVPTTNDGIVTAEEISSLNLHGTRLVVLSACDTGLGEARAGEGVLGLRRGFIEAGAEKLLLTLWPIEDDHSAGFMLELYAAAQVTGDFALALPEVQRRWLRSLRVEKGAAASCRIAGPYILSLQGQPGSEPRQF